MHSERFLPHGEASLPDGEASYCKAAALSSFEHMRSQITYARSVGCKAYIEC
jgi:hypothetical protein